MWLVKENEGVILAAKVLHDGELSEWHPLGLGYKPVLNIDSDGTYVLTLEYMSSLFVRAIDKNVWPPNFVDPIESHGVFTQLRELIEEIPIGLETNTFSVVSYIPTYQIGVRVNLTGTIYYNPFTGLYTYSIRLDVLNTIGLPPNVRAYLLWECRDGVWYPIGDPVATDTVYNFTTTDLTSDLLLNRQYAATFFYGFDPNKPNDNSLGAALQSTIAPGSVLTIPKALAVINSDATDEVRLSFTSDIRADTNVAMPQMRFLKTDTEDIMDISSTISGAGVSPSTPQIFLAIGDLGYMNDTDFSTNRLIHDVVKISLNMTSAGVAAYPRM